MKIGVVITVRIGSSRLPQKALLNVQGKPIISYLVDRIKYEVGSKASIFICTTTLAEDDILEELAKTCGVLVFRGDPENILNRHYQCAFANELDWIVNVDGDDILCHPHYVKQIIDEIHQNEAAQIIKTVDLPFGTNSMAYRKSVIGEILEALAMSKVDTGWGELIKDNSRFKIVDLFAKPSEMIDARLTLDYQEDFDVFKTIIESLKLCKDTPQEAIIDFLTQREDVKNANKFLDKIYWENYYKNKNLEGR